MTLPPINYQKRGRDDRLRSAKHLAFIRKRLCVAWHLQICQGRVEAAHLRDLAPMGHGGARPDDLFTVGMCGRHHRESEKREAASQQELGLDLMALAIEYGMQSPDPAIKAAAKAFLALAKAAE